MMMTANSVKFTFRKYTGLRLFHVTSIAHYDDVIMTILASQITSLTVVYSIVYSGVNQRKHQSSASLAFVREIHRGPVNFPHKWPVTPPRHWPLCGKFTGDRWISRTNGQLRGKCFHLMTSSWDTVNISSMLHTYCLLCYFCDHGPYRQTDRICW